jgi:PAS domain-containing protein
MATVQEWAARFLPCFLPRPHGDQQRLILNDDAPVEAKKLVEFATADRMGDDWRYSFVWEALTVIAKSESPEEACIETDVDDRDLCGWLASDPGRIDYVNQGVRDITGLPDIDQFDILEVIRTGLYLERNEVYWAVLGYLRQRADRSEPGDGAQPL